MKTKGKKMKNKITEREQWVLDNPEFYTVVRYRPNRVFYRFKTYKEAIKKARILWKETSHIFMPLVYAVRETGQTNLNNRKFLNERV